MKVVLDTNCFISCIGKNSRHRKVFDAFLNGSYVLCLSTEVLLEYEEKFNQFWGAKVTYNLLATILTAQNISLHSIFYNFRLVEGDVDDNKFSDLYLSASADILVTNDSKLIALRKKGYPVVDVKTISEFMILL
ncbi:MAG: putative toxin-antitoxin system toxin component, PIN family [Bacteroidia bacterium]